MKAAKKLLIIFGLLGGLTVGGGCSFQDGIQKGLTDGISAALAHMIKTPVITAVDEAVKGE